MAIMQRLEDGGLFMYFILTFGVLTTALIVERWMALNLKYAKTPLDFRQKILAFLGRGDFRSAEAYCQTMPENNLARVIATGCAIRANGGGEEELQGRMDEALTAEISKIDQRVGFLGMFGNVATLLGLLGTISGMIHSFAAVASANPSDRATMLSAGISEAMNCTAFGLLVAIPALVAFAYFQNRTDKHVNRLTESATQIYHDLIFLSESSVGSHATNQNGRNSSTIRGNAVPTMTM